MKTRIVGFVLLAVSSFACADSAPDKKLVDQYLKATQAEQLVAAQIDGAILQYGANAPPEAKAMMGQFYNAAMGWDTVKDQYATLVEKIYTTDELKAALRFYNSPLGYSMVKKDQLFSREMAALIVDNTQRASKQALNSFYPAADESKPHTSELVTADVQEHDLDGRVYFTGTVENRGKSPARGVQIEVNLFSADKFVDQYSTYISGTMAPGVVRYFKISCGCKDSPPAQHDSFKVLVVESY